MPSAIRWSFCCRFWPSSPLPPPKNRATWRRMDHGGHGDPGRGLRFIQESKADAAAAKLKAMINVTATVVRDGKTREVPLRELAPGRHRQAFRWRHDSRRCAGALRKDLFIIQATLTGESCRWRNSTPGKRARAFHLWSPPIFAFWARAWRAARRGLCGGNGARTYLGNIAAASPRKPSRPSFDKGIKKFTWLMLASWR